MFDSRNRRYAGLCSECRKASVKNYRNTKDGYFRNLLGRIGRNTKKVERVNVTEQDLIELWDKQEGKCALTGMPLQHEYMWDGRRFPVSAAMDLVDTLCGYNKGNVRLVCNYVHEMKGKTPLITFLSNCQSVINHSSGSATSHPPPASDCQLVDVDDFDMGSTSADTPPAKEARWGDEV
eukprot:jgi/Mesvir1/18602/Mv17111-RA.1